MRGSRRVFVARILIQAVNICLFLGIVLPAGAAAGVYFTPEETDYLAKGRVLKAASIDGGAPLHYRDAKGEIKGIAVNVLNEIAALTGLVFEYQLYDSIGDAVDSRAEILFGVTKEYAPPGTTLSKPYLYSEAILFYNSSLNPHLLDTKRFAAIKGGTLPQGIKEENTLYLNNREDTIDAVEKGKADYGFGNAYSLAYYTLQNGYKNVVTVPTGKEGRAYCLGLMDKDEVLLSIINKSIETINPSRMDTLILDVASQVERKVTVSMIMETYGKELLGIILLVVTTLSISVFSYVRANGRLKMENKKHEILSYISNECFFEYQIKSGKLEISERFNKEIDIYGKNDETMNLLIDVLALSGEGDGPGEWQTIELPLTNGEVGVFKIVYSNINDESGKLYSKVGKLIDISEEIREKEKLILKSQLDGLTGLYNAATTKELVTASIKNAENKGGKIIDVFAMIDCDKFKNVNDTFGHLQGNLALENVAESLRLTFGKTDILGRIGGDEFCAYMHNIPSVDFARTKCQQLIDLVGELNEKFQMAISIGVAVRGENDTYEDLFQRADAALYLAKSWGGAQVAVAGIF